MSKGLIIFNLGNILEVHKKAFTTPRCFPRSKQNVEYHKFIGLPRNLISDFLLQPGTDEPGLHVVMLDARYDRDPTYSFHGILVHVGIIIMITIMTVMIISIMIIRRVSRLLNSHVELSPVGVAGGGAGQGGRDHCHRVRGAGCCHPDSREKESDISDSESDD